MSVSVLSFGAEKTAGNDYSQTWVVLHTRTRVHAHTPISYAAALVITMVETMG